jgi:hypothetical protein
MAAKASNTSYEDIRKSLPEDLRNIFEMIVEDYKYSAHLHYGKQFVSYVVLGDLIKAGWRRTAEEIE